MFDYYAWAGPIIRKLEPELAHRLTIRALRGGLVPRAASITDPILATKAWNLGFANPIGLAAGFDKNAEVPDAMLALGFGFVEVGTVTPRPQPGNPRPRLFRLPEDQAVINRMGFNNDGIATVARRLARRRSEDGRGLVGGNVGPNKDDADPAAACAAAVAAFCAFVDYLVVNVSSPNTPGLRSLQSRAELARLLEVCREARDRSGLATPLLVKVAPDLSARQRADIAEVALQAGVDGLVATNTTIDRPADLAGRARDEAGGLSGAPLFTRSTDVLADFFRLTDGRLPLIGVGGIGSGAQAYAKIRAGASLLQLYTALIYQWPALVGRIARDLAQLLRRDGFASVAEAVGVDVRSPGLLKAGTAP
ncbi:MAG: quinone-dependent dihydroorotate dehydrogenase [Rhodoplanes sp.]